MNCTYTECTMPSLVRWNRSSYPAAENSAFASLFTILLRRSIALLSLVGNSLTSICALTSGGFFAGKVASLSDAVEGRFDPSSGAMGAMYRARYLNDGYFEALQLLKTIAVSPLVTSLHLQWTSIWTISYVKTRAGETFPSPHRNSFPLAAAPLCPNSRRRNYHRRIQQNAVGAERARLPKRSS
jgi:hypothetical protein